MERVRYDEAKSWFWARTWLWFLMALPASVALCYLVTEGLVKPFGPRAEICAAAGVFSVFVGLIAAYISIQLPWMRSGWRIAFLFNGPAGAAIAAVVGFLAAVLVIAILENDPLHPPSYAVVATSHTLAKYGIGVCALWGFIFGSWFAMRRDKYFIERL